MAMDYNAWSGIEFHCSIADGNRIREVKKDPSLTIWFRAGDSDIYKFVDENRGQIDAYIRARDGTRIEYARSLKKYL
jgi:hypothetical protein